jgi:hypothetical protein
MDELQNFVVSDVNRMLVGHELLQSCKVLERCQIGRSASPDGESPDDDHSKSLDLQESGTDGIPGSDIEFG